MNPTRLERIATFLFVALGLIAIGIAFFIVFIRSQF